jgi:hypothetical protein
MRLNPKTSSVLGAGCALLATGAFAATGSAAGNPAKPAHGLGVFDGSSAKITNPYLPISKFHRTVLRGVDGSQHLRIVRTLRRHTATFHHHGQTIKAAIVKDVVHDTQSGRRIERTVDYFAQDTAGAVYYFGEKVNEYPRHGPVQHGGQWRLGRDTKTPGILMPPRPHLGDSFKSEAVPGVTHETDHVVARGLKRDVAGQTYRRVMRVRENAGPPPEVEFKTYAPGVGVITEANGGIHLIRSIR